MENGWWNRILCVCVCVFCLCVPDCGDAKSSTRGYWTRWLNQWIGVGSSASGSLSLGGTPCCIVVVCIGACQELASGICWPWMQELIQVGEDTKQKREGIVQQVSRMLASAWVHANSAFMMQLCESHRNGVIALMLH